MRYPFQAGLNAFCRKVQGADQSFHSICDILSSTLVSEALLMRRELYLILQRKLPVLVIEIFLSLHPSLEHLVVPYSEKMKVCDKANLGILDVAFACFSIIPFVPIGKHGSS